MVADLDLMINAAMQKYSTLMTDSLIKGIAGGHIEGQVIAARQLGITMGYQEMTPQAIAYADEYARLLRVEGGTMIDGEFVPWMKNYTDDLRKAFGDMIREGLEKGLSRDELGEEISHLLDVTQRHGELIAQHEIRQVQAHAAITQYRDVGLDQVVIVGYDIPDGSVCATCQEYMDHGAYPINEAPFVPVHPNCRHNYAPFIPGVDGKTTEDDLSSIINPYYDEDYRTALDMQYSTRGER